MNINPRQIKDVKILRDTLEAPMELIKSAVDASMSDVMKLGFYTIYLNFPIMPTHDVYTSQEEIDRL